MLWSIDALLGRKKKKTTNKRENEIKVETLNNMMLKTNHTYVYLRATYHSLLWVLHIK